MTSRQENACINSRLLVLEAKRLTLAANERRLRRYGLAALQETVRKLQVEMGDAEQAYQQSVIDWGSPAMPDYWPTAYARLIGLAERLAYKLRETADAVSAGRRYELALEVEVLEELSVQWRRSLRSAIARGAA